MNKVPSHRAIIVVNSLFAEGTPIMTRDICEYWLGWGIEPKVVTLQAKPSDLAPELLRLGVETVSLDLPDGGRWRYAQMSAGMYQIARRFRPSAMLSMPLGWHAFLAAGARAGGVRRVVAHVGGFPPHWTGNAFSKFRLLVQAGRPFTNVLACCSKYVRAGVIHHFGVSERETATVYNGTRIEEFARCALEARAARSEGRPRIGMVARLDYTKDHPTLLRAAAALRRRGMDLELMLIGDGVGRSELERLASELGVQQAVRFLGVRRDVPELLGQLDAFVFSVKKDEGLGIALIEAMAAGVPVVATDAGACREVLDGGLLGVLVPEESPERLADAIAQVIECPEAAQERAGRAREKALRVFTSQAMARAYAQFLELPAGG